MSFQGKSVLVTGGASGIGAATALRFAQAGAQVFVVDRDVEKGNQIVRQIREQGASSTFQEADLADEESIRHCCAAVAQQVSALHVLVNNAGIVIPIPIERTGHDDWDPQMAINLRAPALMARELLPLLKIEGGAIVNVSSEGGFRARADHWVYDATKAGICALTRAMAVEFAPFGIRANSVAPGWTVTEMHFAGAPNPQERKAELESLQMDCILRRLARPEEIANAIFFLASDQASYITAATLHVDGGVTTR